MAQLEELVKALVAHGDPVIQEIKKITKEEQRNDVTQRYVTEIWNIRKDILEGKWSEPALQVLCKEVYRIREGKNWNSNDDIPSYDCFNQLSYIIKAITMVW